MSYFFIAAILLHLALHWRWLWQIAARKRSWPMWVGIGSGLILMLLLIFQPIQHDDSNDADRPRWGRESPHQPQQG